MNTVLGPNIQLHRPVSYHYPPKVFPTCQAASVLRLSLLLFQARKRHWDQQRVQGRTDKDSSHSTCYETTVPTVFMLWTLLINFRGHWTILWFVLQDYFFGSNSLEMHLLWNWRLGMYPLCQMVDTITCRLFLLSCPCSHFYPSCFSLSTLSFSSAFQVC